MDNLPGKCLQDLCFTDDTVNQLDYKEKKRKKEGHWALEIWCLCDSSNVQ